MSGRSRRNSWIRSAATSPSRPTAQKLTVSGPCVRRVQPRGAAASAAIASIVCRRVTIELLTRLLLRRRRRLGEPAAGEARALQSAPDVRATLHELPDEA